MVTRRAVLWQDRSVVVLYFSFQLILSYDQVLLLISSRWPSALHCVAGIVIVGSEKIQIEATFKLVLRIHDTMQCNGLKTEISGVAHQLTSCLNNAMESLQKNVWNKRLINGIDFEGNWCIDWYVEWELPQNIGQLVWKFSSVLPYNATTPPFTPGQFLASI